MNSAELLGPTGPLAQHIDSFTVRPQQQRMATAVAESLQNQQVLVAEAGTGTGKTYAYLVPALLSGLKVIISTGTRNLQDQLFYKDLPLVRAALKLPLDAALLKGRANYLCLYRLNQASSGGRLARTQLAQLGRIKDWVGRTQSGDIAEVTDVPEDSPLWPRVTSTLDNCLGQECPCYRDCFLVKARRHAIEAEVLVVNHHLFCADMVLKEEGFGEILPGADAFILDEAHQLPDVAGRFFGLSISSHQLTELARDTLIEQSKDAADFAILAERAQALSQAIPLLRLALGAEARRTPWLRVAKTKAVAEAISSVSETLADLLEALREASNRSKGLEHCLARCTVLAERLRHFIGEPAAADSASTEIDAESVSWFETRPRSFSLYVTPLDVGGAFQARMSRYKSSWVFTSATLAVGEDFAHFARRLGLQEPATLRLESPFDYARNALLYHPKDMPDPADSGYNQALLEAALPVLQASRGRAFLLFTSHQALKVAAEYLLDKVDYPLLVQGTLPKDILLERFRVAGNAVLLGTASFWEGVDVRGEALSCVIIAKLPFAAPDDPVLQARIDALRRRGGNPFRDYQLPQAVIALKQGVGRLIRDVNDRGVVMLADPRLLSRGYGRVFLNSLPPMPRTQNLVRIEEFFTAPQPAVADG